MDKSERIKLTAQMAATIYAGYLADSNIIGSKELREKCCNEALEIAYMIDLRLSV